MSKIWVADTEPNQRFTLYTRGNVGEVFPHVMTALTGTLIGDAVRQGQIEVFVDMGVLRPREVSGPSVGTGVFGGYLYMSGSAMRLFGVRMPGMSPRDADEQVMGEVTDVPPYRRAKGDRNLIASLTLSRYVLKMMQSPDLGALDLARTDARDWLATMPDLRLASDDQLLHWLGTFAPRQAASMKRLLQFSMLAGAPRGLLDRALAREGMPSGLANRIVGGTGDIDSAQLAQRLWALGRLVAADPSLSELFDHGLDGIADRTRHTTLQIALDAFQADHGHRGNDEYELATPTWSMDPTPVYAAIDRLRHAPADRDPSAAARRLAADADEALALALRLVPRRMRWVTRRCALVSRQGAIGRERAKDILVLENLGARLVLHELVRRAADRGGPTDTRLSFCVTAAELADFVAQPSDFADLIAERAALQHYLDDRIPPPWFDGHIPDPATWPLRSDARPPAPTHGSTVHGIAVSGGTASGLARVIVDPSDPRGLEPGEVLVCAITDPSWTPLFLSAAAVVCDTGAVQSHAAIISRELGIPAVLSVPGITAVADGTMLHVDGTNGTVRIGDRAAGELADRELAARAHAGRAVRDLGHALVGHDNPPELLEHIASTVETMAARLALGPHRSRPGRDMQNRSAEDPPAHGMVFESYPDRPISGAASPWGVDLVISREGDSVVGRCTLRAAHEGAPARSHGGVTAAIFDDLFGFVLAIHQQLAFTGELNVRYVGPAPLHVPLEFRAHLVGRERRKLLMEAEASSEGVVFAHARATFIAVTAFDT